MLTCLCGARNLPINLPLDINNALVKPYPARASTTAEKLRSRTRRPAKLKTCSLRLRVARNSSLAPANEHQLRNDCFRCLTAVTAPSSTVAVSVVASLSSTLETSVLRLWSSFCNGQISIAQLQFEPPFVFPNGGLSLPTDSVQDVRPTCWKQELC
jgi:hypothetical protein